MNRPTRRPPPRAPEPARQPPPVDLPECWSAALEALLTAPVAWRTPAQVAGALGRGVEEATDLLCELDLAGWVAVWESPDGPVVTLSALAAARLSARLVEVGAAATPRWARAGDPDPPPVRPRHVCKNGRAASLEFVPDPEPPPEVALARVCDPPRKPRDDPPLTTPRADDRPRPSAFLGLGLTPWPGPPRKPLGACPACGGRPLRPHVYCLYCDRWGLDRPGEPPAAPTPAGADRARRGESPSSRRTAAGPAAHPGEAHRREAEQLRARRKAKHRGKLLRKQAIKDDTDRRRRSRPDGDRPAPRPA